MSGSIWAHTDKLYAEMLNGKSVTLTIKTVRECQVDGENGKKKPGFRVVFDKAKRSWEFSAVTVVRQFVSAFGSENLDDYAGRRIVIFPDKCKTKFGDYAIRVDVAGTKAANRNAPPPAESPDTGQVLEILLDAIASATTVEALEAISADPRRQMLVPIDNQMVADNLANAMVMLSQSE